MRKIVLLTMVLCLGLALGAFAQPAQPTNVLVDVLVVDTQELINNNPSVVIPTPGVAEYNAGYTNIATGQLIVKSNVPWQLDVRTEAWSSPAGVNKVLTDFEWKRQTQDLYKSCSSVSALVDSGVATGGKIVNVNYRMKLTWSDDAPGDYSLLQLYTLTKDS